MKQKLILFQPKQYNELFSTYHHSKKSLNPYKRVNLPKILTNFPKEGETASSTSRTNNSTINKNKHNFSFKKNSYIFDRNKDIYYPIATQPGSQTTRMSEFLPYPSITQHFKKIIDNKSKERKKFEKNKKDLKMIYLKLLNEENNKNDYKIESFLYENNEKEKDKNDLNTNNENINEINNSNKQKINNMFSQTESNRFNNEIKMINEMPIVLINFFAEEIYKNYYINKNPNTTQVTNSQNISNNKNTKNINIKQSFNNSNINKNAYINNIFFKYVLDNVKHKIELINNKNKQISVLYVKNLLNSELKFMQNQISNLKLHNFTENTSNNISKISNYDITSKNTFHFKTNNSSIKDNENFSTNNNSSVLGSLIKSIYTQRNEGKKKKFDTMNLFHINPKTFFQNKEIISSINNKDEENSSNKIKIIIKLLRYDFHLHKECLN